MSGSGDIVLNPPKLVFGDSAIAHTVKIKLNKKPEKAVGVFFSSPSINFKECLLKFDSNNWNTEQTLTVSPSPFLTKSEKERNLQIDFMLSSRDPAFHLKSKGYDMVRSSEHGGVCTAAGDPHFRNFGGRTFDFMGTGTFYYVKSKYLSVMASLRCPHFNRGVTIATSVAIRYGKSRWMIGINSGERVASANLDGMVIERGGNGAQFRIVCNDGAVISISKNFWQHGEFYLDITITLPFHYKNRVGGICGNIQDGTFLKGPEIPGTPTNNVYEMGNSFAVPAKDDIFKCSARKANGEYGACANDHDLKVHGQFHSCRIPPIPPLSALKTEPKESDGYGTTEGYVVDNKPGKPYGGEDDIPYQPSDQDPLESISPVCEVQAEDSCKAILSHELAQKYVKLDAIMKNCVFDTCAIRPNYIESWKRNYYTLLFELSKAFLQDRTIKRDIRKDVARITLEFGINGRRAKCENKGEQTPIGCCCCEPFTGRHCEVNYSLMQAKRR